MKNMESFRMSAFLDGGGVFEDSFNSSDMRYSAGLGATWLSPFGPLNVSLSTPLNDDELDLSLIHISEPTRQEAS